MIFNISYSFCILNFRQSLSVLCTFEAHVLKLSLTTEKTSNEGDCQSIRKECLWFAVYGFYKRIYMYLYVVSMVYIACMVCKLHSTMW